MASKKGTKANQSEKTPSSSKGKTSKKSNISTPKKTTSKTPAKTSAPVKSENKPTSQTDKNISINADVIGIFVICISIIILIGVIFSSGGIFGQTVGSFMKGSFGIGSYILPLLSICFCISLFFSEDKKINIPKLALSLILFLIFIGFVHSLSREQQTFSSAAEYIKTMYSKGKAENGGLIGACVGDLFYAVLGKIGSFIVFFFSIIACVILLTGKSISETINKYKDKLSLYLSFDLSNDNDIYEEYDENETNYKETEFSFFLFLKNLFSENKQKERKTDNIPSDSEKIKQKEELQKPLQSSRDLSSDTEIPQDKKASPSNTEFVITSSDGKKYREIKPPVIININSSFSKKNKEQLKIAVDEIAEARITRRQEKALAKKPHSDLPDFLKNDTSFVSLDFLNTLSKNDANKSKSELSEEQFENFCNYTDTHYEELESDNFSSIPSFLEIENLFNPVSDNSGKADTDIYPMSMAKPVQFVSKQPETDSDSDFRQNSALEQPPKEPAVSISVQPKETVLRDSSEIPKEIPAENSDSPSKANPAENIKEHIPIIINPEKTHTVNKLDVNEKIESSRPYVFPKLDFLTKNTENANNKNNLELLENSKKLVNTLESFNIKSKVINISQGPAVTRYELSIEDGIKVSKITNLADNLALSLAATSVRIEAPIPGKSAVGIEIPNAKVSSVFLSEVICDIKFQKSESKISFGMGKDIAGNVIVSDIAKMPHLLVAGQTGSGKSVCVNTIISSILYKANPEEVKLIMVDPKVVELSIYNGIPHLLIPVVTEPDKAKAALDWAVVEMDDRYKLMAKFNVRNLAGYNAIMAENGLKKLPQLVIIIDELADLMMVAAKEIEASICRLAQKARAAGIHIIIATQRPSADVITGLIKANIPSRIAFAVSSGIDSRTILDSVGAEKLLGKGDMLFKPVDKNKPLRIQGAFISDNEVENIVEYIKANNEAKYDEDIMSKIDAGSSSSSESVDFGSDELTDDVIGFLVKKGKGSTSLIQRKFQIGYNRAARIMEELEDRGIVGPASSTGSKQRDVYMDMYQYEEYCTRKKDYI